MNMSNPNNEHTPTCSMYSEGCQCEELRASQAVVKAARKHLTKWYGGIHDTELSDVIIAYDTTTEKE